MQKLPRTTYVEEIINNHKVVCLGTSYCNVCKEHKKIPPSYLFFASFSCPDCGSRIIIMEFSPFSKIDMSALPTVSEYINNIMYV